MGNLLSNLFTLHAFVNILEFYSSFPCPIEVHDYRFLTHILKCPT